MAFHKKDSEQFYSQFLETVEKFIPQSYFQQHVLGTRKFELFENPQFQELLRHSPAIVGVFNNINMGYEFMSDNMEAMTGHSPESCKGPHGMEYVLSTFPPEHATIYTQQIFPTIFEYFQNYAATQDIKKFRFTASFQLIKKDKSVIWCMQQLNVIETDEQGLPLLTLLFMSDITHVKKDNSVDFVIACKDDKGVFQNVQASTFPPKEDGIHFTKRELELLPLLSQGKSSTEIAALLSISEHTVNTHRQNMLEKSGKKNTAELLSFVIGKGFIK